MTIPIDNLYYYIHNLVNNIDKNTLLYYFYPNGSKKIKDLKIFLDYDESIPLIYLPTFNKTVSSWEKKLLFCYDQEPLNFNLYTNISESTNQLYAEFYNSHINYFTLCPGIYQKFILKRNFAAHPAHVHESIYDKKLLLHSEKNSADLKKYEKNGFLGIYYWSHAFIALDWYRFAEHDKSLDTISKTNFSKDFNIYCRSWTGSREYRFKFLELLNQNSIDKNSNIFFNEYCDENHYSLYKAEDKKWQARKENIDNLTCDINRKSNASASATYDPVDYKNSAIDVVLETVFDRDKIQLTEKILRPIACGKPFILVSEKGSLEYLKSYGFKTFGDLVDESYDSISNPVDRLHAVINIMKNISTMSNTSKNQLFLEMHKIAEENKKWFFSNEFFNIIDDELKNNLQKGISILDNPEFQTTKKLRVLYRAFKMHYRHLNNYEKKFAKQFILRFPHRIRLSKKNIGIS